jgi:hypothetical protein
MHQQRSAPVHEEQTKPTSTITDDIEFLTLHDPKFLAYMESSQFNEHGRKLLIQERLKDLRNAQSEQKSTQQKQTERVKPPTALPPARPTFDFSNIEGNSTVDPFMGKAR